MQGLGAAIRAHGYLKHVDSSFSWQAAACEAGTLPGCAATGLMVGTANFRFSEN
jgi:hypothetical protein